MCVVDDDEAGPTGDGDDDDDEDDEDDEGSDGDEVGLSYLMKDGIQVRSPAAQRQARSLGGDRK